MRQSHWTQLRKSNPSSHHFLSTFYVARRKTSYLIIFILCLFLAFALYVALTPASNNRDWQSEYMIQSHGIVKGDSVTFLNIRNQTYNLSGPTSLSYYTQTFNVSELTTVHFYVITLSHSFKGVAHTFFEFNFKNGSAITLSVEARREIGEEYSVWTGMLRSFEIFYVWSPLTDSVARREVWQRPPMIRFQIKSDAAFAQHLFVQLVHATNELQEHPRYYNTLFSTCTSNLLDAAREVYPQGLPWTVSRYLPGYTTKYLYNLGFIDTNLSLSDLETSYLPLGTCCSTN